MRNDDGGNLFEQAQLNEGHKTSDQVLYLAAPKSIKLVEEISPVLVDLASVLIKGQSFKKTIGLDLSPWAALPYSTQQTP